MTVTKLSFADKMLPIQPEYRKDFSGNETAHLAALFDAMVRSSGLCDPEEEFELETTPKFTIAEMGSAPMVLRLLQLLVRLIRAHRVLEIGTFIGVSGLYMAKALPEDGRLTTIEKYEHFAEIAKRNFERNGVATRAHVIVGDAFEVIDRFDREGESFDLIFLDGNKERYADYFLRLTPRLRPGGLFVTDDVFFHGDALNREPQTEKGRGVRRFLDAMAERTDFTKLLIPIANGVFLAQKL